MMKQSFISIILFLYTPFLTFSQVTFTATTDAKQVAIGDVFEVKFMLSNAKGDRFNPPLFSDFSIVGGPSRSSTTQGVNGVWTSSESINYILQGKKEGKFTIGSASIVANGKTYTTAPLSIEIVQGKKQTFGKLPDNSKEGIILRAELSKAEAYMGQQIILDFKIFSRVDVNDMDIVKEPNFDGFFKQKINNFPQIDTRVTIGGKQYLSRIIGRIALFPQKEGILTIDPITAQVSIIKNDPRDPFSDPFFGSLRAENVMIQSNTIQLKVKSLPPNTPPQYSGGVGTFTVQSFMSKTNGSTDDALSLKMIVTGNGDSKKWIAPKMQPMDGLEIYEAKTLKDETNENQGEFQTIKEFEYLIVPKKTGQFTLKPEFAYFDTEGGEYKILSDNVYNLTISQGTNKVATVSSDDEPTASLKKSTGFASRFAHFFEKPVARTLSIVLLLFIGGYFGFKLYKNLKKQQAETNNSPNLIPENAQHIAQTHLAQAQNYMQAHNQQAFYEEISKAMFSFASNKLAIPLSEFSKSNIEEKLNELKVKSDSINNFLAVIKNCEKALFGGQISNNDNSSQEYMKKTYQEAMQVIVDIEKEIS